MGWNPANWAIVNQLQGQNQSKNSISPYANGTEYGSEQISAPNTNGGGYQQSADLAQKDAAIYAANGIQTYAGPKGITPYTPPAQAGVTPVDPYAKYGGQAAFNAKRNTYGASQNSYKAGAQTTLRDVGNTYNDKTNSFVNEIDTGQGDINRGFAGNELNLRRSMQNIVRGIQTGVRSGGVALAGMNASDSGAADALARAYAKVGNSQTGEARGQAAAAAEELQRSQGQLNLKRTQGEEALNTFRDTETGRVRGDFGSKLDMLAADAEGNGFGGVVEKSLVDQVLGEALARLSQIDQSRQQRLAGVRQWTPEEIMAEAIRMDEAGQAGTAFQVTGPDVSYGRGVPVGGAPLGQMPIYTKGREDQQVVIPGRREEAIA